MISLLFCFFVKMSTNPYFNVIYNYCRMVIDDEDEHGEFPFNIDLELKDKIPMEEFFDLKLNLQNKLYYYYDDFNVTITEDGLCVADINDNSEAIDNVTNINDTKEEKEEERKNVIDAYVYNLALNQYVMKNNNFIISMTEQPPCIIGKKGDDGILPLDDDDLIIAQTLPFPVKLI